MLRSAILYFNFDLITLLLLWRRPFNTNLDRAAYVMSQSVVYNL